MARGNILLALVLCLVTDLVFCHGATADVLSAPGETLGKALTLSQSTTTGGETHVLGPGAPPKELSGPVARGQAGSGREGNENDPEGAMGGNGTWVPLEALRRLVTESAADWGSPSPRRQLLAAKVPAACPKRCTTLCSPGNCVAMACCASQMSMARCVDYVAAAAACQKKKGPKSVGCGQATALYSVVGSTQVLLARASQSCPSLKTYATFYGVLRSWITGLRTRCC